MTIWNVLEIIVVVLCAITYGFMLYFKVRGNVLSVVSELIALAEQSGLTGPEKMDQVVSALYAKIPAFMKKIFTEKWLRGIAQTIFNWMRKYADEYANRIGNDEQNSEETPTNVIDTAAVAELIAELLRLTVPELKQKAEEYGIDLEGISRKDDILKAIVEALLKKA